MIGCLEEVSVTTRCLTRDIARLLLCLLLTGWASLFGGYASASADCSVPRKLNSTRPDADGAPTRVAVGIYLIDLQERLQSTGG